MNIDAMDERCRKQLGELFHTPVKWDCPLRDYTSFGIGGPAEALVSLVNCDELGLLLGFLSENDVDWRIIGRGTNLLVRDQGFTGVIVILTGEFRNYAVRREGRNVILEAGAGCSLAGLSTMCCEKGYSGLEFATGIPGSIGGALVMNAGAWGRSIADVVLRVDVQTDKEKRSYLREQLNFEYRRARTLLKERCVVTGCTAQLELRPSADIREVCRRYREQRNDRQPLGFGNAGSVFKNPAGESAGRLIESSGLKGLTIGGAQVSEKHANFIINRGAATAADVLNLISHIQEKVEKDSGILLEPEVHVL